jgi:predicted transcriptional regulator
VVRLPRERRHRLQIYYEILSAIEVEMYNDGNAKPTRLGHYSNLSYDKLKKYLEELDKTDLINMQDGAIEITEKGRQLLRKYDKLINTMHTVGLDY